MSLSIQKVVDTIGIPTEEWRGNCFGIANELVKHNLVRGKAVYGNYHGFIHENCPEFGGRKFPHHGWVARRSTIVDPTRWVFENVDPYIYIGPKDNPDYDFGGNALRKKFMRPAPIFDSTQRSFNLPDVIKSFVQFVLGDTRSKICLQQVVWLANLPLDILGKFAKPLYQWIAEDIGFPAWIPIDNRLHILGQ